MSNSHNTQVLRSVTERVVDSFTSLGMLFTALDISNGVKSTLPDIRHREVSPLVRDLFENGAMGDYDQTLIDVVADGGKKVQAYLYHLPDQDPTMYDDKMRAQLAIPPVPTGLAPSDDPNIGPGTLEALVAIGKDGRGRVPRQLLVNAGINDNTVLIAHRIMPDRLILSAGTGATPDASSVVITSDHPTLVQVPSDKINVFPSNTRLMAHVMGNIVEIVPAP